MKRILLVLLAVPALAIAQEEGARLDRSPNNPGDLVSVQAGARTFVNYCLGCHSLKYMRYHRLESLGLTAGQIKDDLMFTADKIGANITTPMSAEQGKSWFGVPPPDLSVEARVRGADWLYTYLRSFYLDPKTVTGWNNAVFPNVAMPQVLWHLQGERDYDPESGTYTQVVKGEMSPVEYDRTVRDLVNFLVYVGEPAAIERREIGIWVLFALAVMFVLAWLLKREYWKDVH